MVTNVRQAVSPSDAFLVLTNRDDKSPSFSVYPEAAPQAESNVVRLNSRKHRPLFS